MDRAALSRMISIRKKSDIPLISLICPTYNREQYLSGIIRQFKRQTYPNCELVIVDNSVTRSTADGLLDNNIFYTHIPRPRHSVGKMRNLCCQFSQGLVIQHFDSDDFYHPEFVNYQYEFLKESGKAVVGCHNIDFWDERDDTFYRLECPGRPVSTGNTLMYYKSWWMLHQFKDTSIGEDVDFRDRAKRSMQGPQLASHAGVGRVVARLHTGNTWICPKTKDPDITNIDGKREDWWS